jgi:hypothetical protein
MGGGGKGLLSQKDGRLHVPVQNLFQPFPVPADKSLFFLDDKGGVLSDPVPKGLVKTNGRISVNQLDKKTMLIEFRELSDPVRKAYELLLQVLGVIVHRLLIEFFLKPGMLKKRGTVTTMIERRHYGSHNFEKNRFHPLLL